MIIFNSKPIPNRLTARRVHEELQANGASHYEIGDFYRTMLGRRLWPTQASMGEFLNVPSTSLSRMLALTKIPKPIVKAVGGPERLSFRLGELLLDAIAKVGEPTMIARAREAISLGYHSTDDVLELLITNRRPIRRISQVSVKLSRDKKTLKVEIPELGRLIPHLERFERFLATALVVFEADLNRSSEAPQNILTSSNVVVDANDYQ